MVAPPDADDDDDEEEDASSQASATSISDVLGSDDEGEEELSSSEASEEPASSEEDDEATGTGASKAADDKDASDKGSTKGSQPPTPADGAKTPHQLVTATEATAEQTNNIMNRHLILFGFSKDPVVFDFRLLVPLDALDPGLVNNWPRNL